MKIQACNLKKVYARNRTQDVEVFRDINLTIEDGERVSLVGPSGIGKSTLIHILGLMDKPTEGQVFFNGTDCFSKDSAFLRKMRKEKIGFIFQYHYLLSDFTVLENTLLPVWDKKDEKMPQALAILDRVGLSDRLKHFPNEISGGQQQRAALARALINEPSVIFADEPTGNLDRAAGKEVENILFSASIDKKITLVVVSHNEALAAKADRIIQWSSLQKGF